MTSADEKVDAAVGGADGRHVEATVEQRPSVTLSSAGAFILALIAAHDGQTVQQVLARLIALEGERIGLSPLLMGKTVLTLSPPCGGSLRTGVQRTGETRGSPMTLAGLQLQPVGEHLTEEGDLIDVPDYARHAANRHRLLIDTGEARKADRPSALMGRPAGGPAAQDGGAAREANRTRAGP